MSKTVTRDAILLTGAGFTKNFGGFLAEEMWAQILNHPRIVKASAKLRQLLITGFDFEAAYSDVVDSPEYSDLDRKAMAEAVETAYRRLDEAIRNWVFRADSPHPVNWYGVQKLLHLFSRQ